MGQNQARRCLEEFARWLYQLHVRQLQCFVEFVSMRHRGGGVAKSVIYDCLVDVCV